MPAASSASSPAPRTPVWLWPHVLSFEAPAVAMLWLAGLAHVNDFPLMPGVLPGLGLAVWLIYLTDRVLDASATPANRLGPRHRFYRTFRLPLMLVVMPAVAGVLAWLGLWVVPVGLLTSALLQLLPIVLYLVLYSVSSIKARRRMIQGGMLILLLLVSTLPVPMTVRITASMVIAGVATLAIALRWHERVEQLFRKETAAGLLFAFGCTTWTRFHTQGSDGPETWVELILLGLLFISNLALTSAREGDPETAPASARATLHMALVMCLLAFGAVLLESLPASLLPILWAVLAGMIGLEVLWRMRAGLSPEAFRVWADIVVALPAACLLLLPDARPMQAAAAAACCL